MQVVLQILFALVLLGALWLFSKRIKFIRRNILLGKDDKSRNDNSAKRWQQVALFAFGQKKMFKRMWPALLHFVVYAGFILINIEVLEIVIDGIFGTHRIFAPLLGAFYPVFISFFEILAVGVFIACIIFLWRRNVTKVQRFHKREMKGWPTLDANLILIFEIILVGALLKMNALDQVLQAKGAEHYVQTGNFLVSQSLTPLFEGWSISTLVVFERTLWWIHILGILFFLNYVTYSKHLHIMLAFPNSYYADLDTPKGTMQNMPEIQNEVAMMMNPDAAFDDNAPPPPERFGAKDVSDLSWKNLLDAYSCTECGRCTAVCPANNTGKQLSPRKIMMDTRDRVEELGAGIDKNGKDYNDGKSLIGDYISHEELRACTTCNACVEECPVNINPLDIILKLRRHMIMDEAQSPNEWNVMFGNVENNMAPWAFPADDRFNWANNLETKKDNA
ncbi:4Fe-4S dicluster domain-containing protein [bacterium]|nr:4Fe-4S dicluster domain-containing protein [bacterium]